ncbi:hypothetical protein [Micromonospora sp. WMMD812]|uniref:hypothetical protein n=1 Tax=Micromonospora sp. WMMD812 TaxID=3015152 RepID=UPI00248B1BC2|nr:hypothetical protein [Micromonospora sp. WMMD812]WBB70670.1 hypothetical protein O7603_15500 [Micromonospora sp. WMMD812]
MIRLRTILTVGATAAATVALAAAPAQADTVDRHAHAHFDSNGGGSMYVDVTRPATGATLVDVEWQKSACGLTDGVYACDSVYRTAYDVPVTRFTFALTGARLTATVPYRETRRHCEIVNEDEVCDEPQESTGTTDLQVTWTASGEPTRERRTGEDGTVYVTTSVNTTVAGSGFGSAYDDPASSFGQLARVRTVPPAA